MISTFYKFQWNKKSEVSLDSHARAYPTHVPSCLCITIFSKNCRVTFHTKAHLRNNVKEIFCVDIWLIPLSQVSHCQLRWGTTTGRTLFFCHISAFTLSVMCRRSCGNISHGSRRSHVLKDMGHNCNFIYLGKKWIHQNILGQHYVLWCAIQDILVFYPFQEKISTTIFKTIIIKIETYQLEPHKGPWSRTSASVDLETDEGPGALKRWWRHMNFLQTRISVALIINQGHWQTPGPFDFVCLPCHCQVPKLFVFAFESRNLGNLR